jgi:hypothetical protein
MELLNTHPIKKSDLGFHGNLFGGKLFFGGKLIFMSMNYRKIWEHHYGKIPKDDYGRTFDIHHIDGNRNNNSIGNLICLSIEDHYKIHLKQFNETKSEKEFRSLVFLSKRMNRDVSFLTGWTVSDETKEKIRKSLKGKKRPDCVVEKMRQSLKNYEWSDEHKKKRRDGLLKFYQDTPPEMRLQWKKNISESLKGKKVKESTKEKLSRINSKLTDDEVLEIYNLINQNVRYKLISEKYNISLSQITSIKQKKTYKWLWN